ncbi:hypothetical protein [Terrilactibacillus laevilacticus]|uniref:Uncharacterized protein n=1 Tax=Terrilactibacillus laevilacticus TaxID=1380157 RepID=A0ABW5PTA4_9BACI|nr:hypothetical protein [Terrilactibacillus laevilacticus]
MDVLTISKQDWILNLEFIDFTEAEGYDLGYEFETALKIKRNGFNTEINSFYFTSRSVYGFYKSMKEYYRSEKNHQPNSILFTLESDTCELKFVFRAHKNKELILSVGYNNLNNDDSLKISINLDIETLPYIIESIDDFFLAFPLEFEEEKSNFFRKFLKSACSKR